MFVKMIGINFLVQNRDAEFLRQQEERRKANSVGEETETRMRGSTVKPMQYLNVGENCLTDHSIIILPVESIRCSCDEA